MASMERLFPSFRGNGPVTNIEDELIRRAQSGDTDAFCLLAERYERRIYSLAFHYSHNAQDAEDLSQEAWLRAYQAIRTFRAESSFYTWLRRITINCFLNHRRAKSLVGRRSDIEVSSLELVSKAAVSSLSSERVLHNQILLENVRQALSELTAQQRLIF